ncbi:MAG: pyrimidine dimer DNA glycosylase/endonuclease V [Candidatus Promineifilaceae bacterium]|nr:pyrimidine dimer DNA glycosylase/endonuclease V [Candidatus Promineifilaceae bacterium]
MTRINCVPPHVLHDSHLLAEYREMLRLRRLHPRETMPRVRTYRLGAGHVLFFADKGKWLLRRHAALREEMERRGFQTNYELDLSHWPPEAMGDWEPPVEAKLLNASRLYVRLKERS